MCENFENNLDKFIIQLTEGHRADVDQQNEILEWRLNFDHVIHLTSHIGPLNFMKEGKSGNKSQSGGGILHTATDCSVYIIVQWSK